MKRIVFLLIAALVFTAIPVDRSFHADYAVAAKSTAPKGNWINYAAKKYAGGDGTEKKPYIIETAKQLALLAKRINAGKEKGYYFKITKDWHKRT